MDTVNPLVTKAVQEYPMIRTFKDYIKRLFIANDKKGDSKNEK